MMETPETNVKLAALNLLRYKMLKEVARSMMPCLTVEELNDILIVAGLPAVTPKELEVKEIDVLLEKEG